MSDFKIVKLVDPAVILQFSGGINPTGPYNGATAYATGDSVSYLGGSYTAIQAGTGNLPTNTSFWQLLAEKGDTGTTGAFTETFEIVSKNLNSWNYSLNYTLGNLTSIIYTDGVDTITKTLYYTTGDLTSIELTGDTPAGITLVKTLTYTTGNLTGIAYS
jgi:hypothetical protein